jgi:Leucine Rich repeat
MCVFPWYDLFLSLSLSPCSTLRELSLRRCGLGGEDSQTILRALLTNSVLNELCINLAGNKFDDKDIQACTLTINRGLDHIRTLDLSHSRLKEKGFVALLRSISQAEASTLDTLILDNAYAGSGTSSAVEGRQDWLMDSHDCMASPGKKLIRVCSPPVRVRVCVILSVLPCCL